MLPSRRQSAIFLFSLWASVKDIGINSSVSWVAYPNIKPWSGLMTLVVLKDEELPDHQLQYLHRPCLRGPSVRYLGLVYEWRLMFDMYGNQWLCNITIAITQEHRQQYYTMFLIIISNVLQCVPYNLDIIQFGLGSDFTKHHYQICLSWTFYKEQKSILYIHMWPGLGKQVLSTCKIWSDFESLKCNYFLFIIHIVYKMPSYMHKSMRNSIKWTDFR